MTEIDPVILELRAKVEKYQRDVERTTTKVENLLDRQEKSARKLEREMKRSSGAISGHLRGIATTLATYFSGRELVGLLDSFTRLQNNLRVAGLEGEELARVQQNLLDISQRYGVELESLTGVFLKASLAQQELGASTSQIVRLNEIIAASLKITGTSAAEAQGALLQLGQALGSGVVRAEEFNSLLEGALPIVQAAARGIDGMEGSVSKLRAAVVDGQITSKQFFDGVLRGGVQTINEAEKATLTLAGGFTALTSALTVYFGEADKANGVSAALGQALKTLADNLDILIPAIATVATLLGGRFVISAVAASGAMRAITAYAAIATTSLAGTALAASSAGSALLAAFGGPVGATILAIGAAMYVVSTNSFKAAEASVEYRRQQEALSEIQKKTTDATEKLATATGRARAEALANAKALREETKQYLANAEAAQLAAVSKAIEARTAVKAAETAAKAPSGGGGFAGLGGTTGKTVRSSREQRQAQANLRAADKNVIEARNELARIEAIIAGKQPPAVGTADAGDSGKSSKASGPSAADIRQRFNDELVSISQRALAAEAAIADTADERAELELRSLELARVRAKADIESDKDYTAAQKARLLQHLEVAAQLEREAIEFDRRREIERDQQDLAREQFRIDRDTLQIQYDLADSQTERKNIALRMIELEERYERSLLEAIVASETATQAEKERARLALEALGRLSAGRQESAARANETDAERYLRNLNKSPQAINEAIDGINIDGLEALNDGLVDAVRGVRSLGDVFKNVANQIVADLLRIAIQQTLIKPLANALFGGGGGGGGGLFGTALSIFGGGRASGGPVSAGQTYLVGENGPELLRMGSQPGFVVPNHQITRGGGGGGMATVRLELSGDIDARIQRVSGPVAVEVVRASAPSVIDAAAKETLSRARRPGL